MTITRFKTQEELDIDELEAAEVDFIAVCDVYERVQADMDRANKRLEAAMKKLGLTDEND